MTRPSDLVAPLSEAVAPVVTGAGLFLEDLTVAAHGRRHVVRVVLDLPDGPGGVSSDALAEVSRKISAVLDDVDVVPGTYTLEVSTPGAERALRTPRHYRRAEGRLIRLELADGPPVTGRVRSADDEAVTLDVDGAARTVPYATVRHAKVQVELKRADDGEG